MQLAIFRGCFLAVVFTSFLRADEPTLEYPLIQGYGGVARIDQAAELPRKGAKIVFDISTDVKPDEVNRGLESVARYLNLCAPSRSQAGGLETIARAAWRIDQVRTLRRSLCQAYRREAQPESAASR